MNRPNDDLPEIISVATCPSGWFARYTGDNPDEPLIEPIAAWGALEEFFNGKPCRSWVALVPLGGELVPARDAENFEEVFYCGYLDEPSKVAPQQQDKILSILTVMNAWIERAKTDQASFLTASDLSAHQVHLRQIADLLGRRG